MKSTHKVALLAVFVSSSGYLGSIPALSQEGSPKTRKVNVEDALAVKEFGSVAANALAGLLAVETGGHVVVIDSQAQREIAKLRGRNPEWSPDGKSLAFFSSASGKLQLHVWTAATGTERQLTKLASGIHRNDLGMTGTCERSSMIAWSPDSRSTAFTSMELASEPLPEAGQDHPAIRVYRSSPLDQRWSYEAAFKTREVLAGLLWEADDWNVLGGDPHHADVISSVAQRLEAGANRVAIADAGSGEVRFLQGEAAQHLCPVWSPDGRTIASIADVTPPTSSNERYVGLGAVAQSTVALHDVRSGKERLLPAAGFDRVNLLAWPERSRLPVAIVEAGQKIRGFSRLIKVSDTDAFGGFVDTPGGHAVEHMRAGRDGTVVLKLAGRFADTLWKYDPGTDAFTQIPTFDWWVAGYDAADADHVAFWAGSAHFHGRLVLSAPGTTAPRVIYDANPQLAELRLGEQRRLTWLNSQGEEVDGIVILPPDYRPDRRYPVVVDAYPRPATDNLRLGAYVESQGQLLASEGFVVFRPSIRAPHGTYWYSREEAYQLKAVGAPGVDLMVDDFESGVRMLVAQGIADPDRIGLYGHSNGGWVANMLVTESKTPAAVAISAGISNTVMMALWPTVMTTRGIEPATGGNVFDDLDTYVRLSPIFRMREVETPMLLMIGDHDTLWVPQMISQFGVLRAEGRDVTLVRYTEEGHIRASHDTALDAHRRVTAFFRQHLGLAPHSAGN